MVHKSLTRELQDRAALHSLGLLDADQAGRLESHITGCEICRDEVRRFQEAAVQLAFDTATEPPVQLRSRILAAIADPKEEIAIIRKGQSKWIETPFPGVLMNTLYEDPATRNVTQLIRLTPGAQYPAHHHMTNEQCYVIEGDLKIGDDVFGPGDFTVAPSGTNHGEASSRNGCLLLIVASPDNQVPSCV